MFYHAKDSMQCHPCIYACVWALSEFTLNKISLSNIWVQVNSILEDIQVEVKDSPLMRLESLLINASEDSRHDYDLFYNLLCMQRTELLVITCQTIAPRMDDSIFPLNLHIHSNCILWRAISTLSNIFNDGNWEFNLIVEFWQYFPNQIFIIIIIFIELTVLSFFHLCKRPKIPDETDNSPSDGGYKWKYLSCYPNSWTMNVLYPTEITISNHSSVRNTTNIKLRYNKLFIIAWCPNLSTTWSPIPVIIGVFQ